MSLTTPKLCRLGPEGMSRGLLGGEGEWPYPGRLGAPGGYWAWQAGRAPMDRTGEGEVHLGVRNEGPQPLPPSGSLIPGSRLNEDVCKSTSSASSVYKMNKKYLLQKGESLLFT